MFLDKNVTACDLPEIIVCNYKEFTYNVVKDISVDEEVPMMQEMFLFNEKDSINVDANHLESKSSQDIKFEDFVDTKDSRKLYQDHLIVTREEVKNDSEVFHEVGCEKSSPSNVVATSISVSKDVLTLKDIISMEDSQKPLSKNNINGSEEQVDCKAEEPKANSLRYHPFEMVEPENQRLYNVPKDSYDPHHLFSRNALYGFEGRSFSEAEAGLAHITYSGPISVSGSLSVRSDGSTVSAHSFAFPILQSEWNSSPVRMVKAENRQLRKEKGWRHYSLLLCCRF